MIERLVAGKNCLPLSEEQELCSLTEQVLVRRIRELFASLVDMKLSQFSTAREQIVTLNSLLWIYGQKDGVVRRFNLNLRILWQVNGLHTIKEFAEHVGMNASFIGKLMVAHPKGGIGGWNFENVCKMAGSLGVRPEVMLLDDLERVVRTAAGMRQSDEENS